MHCVACSIQTCFTFLPSFSFCASSLLSAVIRASLHSAWSSFQRCFMNHTIRWQPALPRSDVAATIPPIHKVSQIHLPESKASAAPEAHGWEPESTPLSAVPFPQMPAALPALITFCWANFNSGVKHLETRIRSDAFTACLLLFSATNCF